MEGLWSTVLAYLWNHKIIVLVVVYIQASCLLTMFAGVDVGIPCLWKKMSGISCPGCGLTSAYIHFLKLDWVAAFHSNPLIFIVIPAGAYYLIRDFKAFAMRERRPKPSA